MTDPSIPPCPVCGTVPPVVDGIWVLYTCGHFYGPARHIPISAWKIEANEMLGRALRTHGIHTLAELESRLAPDPRVAVLESYGVSTADETACLIMLAARGSRTEIHTTEKLDDTLVLSVIKNLRSIGETQMFASLKRIAAQRGEGVGYELLDL